MYRPKVMIADDHALLHDALKKFLEDDCDVACVRDGLALVNIGIKDMGGGGRI